MVPKSGGVLVMDEITKYLRHMRALQAERGYTDAEMKRRFICVRDSLHLRIEDDSGFWRYLRKCFYIKIPSILIHWEGEFQPFQILTHRKLGHKMIQLSETGDIIATTDASGNDVPVRPRWRAGRTDRATAFNPDMLSGYVQ